MSKRYTENDEIELRLVPWTKNSYDLEWRYKEPHKFLFFNLKDWWKTLDLYKNPLDTPEEDPNDEFFWDNVKFPRTGQGIAEFEALKSAVKTKKELYDYYDFDAHFKHFEEDLKAHRMWMEKTKWHIERLTKEG